MARVWWLDNDVFKTGVLLFLLACSFSFEPVLEARALGGAEDLEALRDKLIAAGGALQLKAREQEEAESRLLALEKETASRQVALGETRRRLALLTRLLVQFSRRSLATTFWSEEPPDTVVRRAILVRALLPRLKGEAEALAGDVAFSLRLQEQTEAQRRAALEAQKTLQKEKDSLNHLVQERRAYLARTAEEKAALEQGAQALSAQARDSSQLVEKVSLSSWEKAVERGADRARLRQNDAIRLPVSGKIVRGFGQRDEFGVVSEGVTLSAAAGGPVLAPRGGRVMFAGAFHGYGKVVIVQHEGGGHSFLSGFAKIETEVGQTVEAGEPLGFLPAKGEGKPDLYFEYRQKGHPVNPL